jgi:hypothetical protein
VEGETWKFFTEEAQTVSPFTGRGEGFQPNIRIFGGTVPAMGDDRQSTDGYHTMG